MKKILVYMMTAATVLTVTAAQPLTAFAANGAYRLSGNCQNKVVIAGNDCWNVNGIAGSWNLDCIQRPAPFGFGPNGNFGNGNQENGGGNFDDENNQDFAQSAWTQQVVKLVNEERAKAGLSELKLNTSAAAAAQRRTEELLSSFSHTRPDGSHFSTALKEYGVSYSSSGENIAYGQTSAEAVMSQWMNSSGHRANILNPDFTEIGVGHVQTDSGVHYWTQLFIR